MYFTVATHNEAKNTKGFINYEDVEFSDIPKMVTSGKCYMSGKMKNEIRLDKNYNGNEDVLILDIDDGCTIDQAMEIFKPYIFFLITTRNHQKIKNDNICDRFRIFILLNKTINDIDTRTKVFDSVYCKYPFVDIKCKNFSRLYFSSPADAIVHFNKGKSLNIEDLINISTFKLLNKPQEPLKEKKNSIGRVDSIFVLQELTGTYMNEYGEILECSNDGNFSKESMIKGAKTIFDRDFYKGNANNCIFSVAIMLIENGMDKDEMSDFIIKEVESRSGYPFNKTMSAIKSAIRKAN